MFDLSLIIPKNRPKSELFGFGGPTGNRTRPSSMPWMRNADLLWAPHLEIILGYFLFSFLVVNMIVRISSNYLLCI